VLHDELWEGDDEDSPQEPAEESAEEPAQESTALVPPTLITHEAVVAARDNYLQKLRRELVRFLASVSNMGRVDQVWITGGGSQLPGVDELLTDVFGCRPQPLAYMDRLQHNLDAEEASRLEPRLAVAFGLALGQLGGVAGFNFRQEDLVFTRGFDRMKLPLAIACMLGLFLLCFMGLKLRKELTNLERQIGVTVTQRKASTNRPSGRSGRSGSPANLPRFTGYLGRLVNRGGWAQQYLGKKYPTLLRQLNAKPVFERIYTYYQHLKRVSEGLAGGAGQIAGYELDSGCAVLQEVAEVIENNKQSLGRILVCELTIKLPPHKTGRSLTLKVAFRGDDFRTRQANLKAAFEDQMRAADSAFQSTDDGKEELFRAGSGAYFTLKVELKDKIPVRQVGG
jgi:hypothetical protein